MQKPTLFIGSSKEAKPIVKDIHVRLEETASIQTWYHDTFFLGEHAIESLRRQILQADYALLIATPDDPVTVRDQPGFTARDNVLFELGMFMGTLGPRRSFYLIVSDHRGGQKRDVNIPSDLAGITRLQVTRTDDGSSYNSDLGAACVRLEGAIARGQNNLELSLLPSTPLAIGYFSNFVLQVCKTLINKADLKVGEAVHDCRNDSYDFHIVLPDRGIDSGHEGFSKFTRTRQLQPIEVASETSPRRFPFFVDSQLYQDPATGKTRVRLYDCPTTLLAAREAIQLASSRGTTQDEIEAMERREVQNFDRTLRRLLKEPSAANFCENIKLVYANALPAKDV
jgi:hypothetical protein